VSNVSVKRSFSTAIARDNQTGAAKNVSRSSFLPLGGASEAEVGSFCNVDQPAAQLGLHKWFGGGKLSVFFAHGACRDTDKCL